MQRGILQPKPFWINSGHFFLTFLSRSIFCLIYGKFKLKYLERTISEHRPLILTFFLYQLLRGPLIFQGSIITQYQPFVPDIQNLYLTKPNLIKQNKGDVVKSTRFYNTYVRPSVCMSGLRGNAIFSAANKNRNLFFSVQISLTYKQAFIL